MEIPVQPANHSGKLALLLKHPCWGRGRKKTEERTGGKRGRRGGRGEEKRRRERRRRGRTQVNFIRALLSGKHMQPSFT